MERESSRERERASAGPLLFPVSCCWQSSPKNTSHPHLPLSITLSLCFLSLSLCLSLSLHPSIFLVLFVKCLILGCRTPCTIITVVDAIMQRYFSFSLSLPLPISLYLSLSPSLSLSFFLSL